MANGFGIGGVGPGMVTSNVVGSTYQAPTPEQERWRQMMQQRQWEKEDRRFRQQEEGRMYALGRQRSAQEQAEQEGKMRQAYNMLMGPTVQSQWDVLQGQGMGGVKRPVGMPSHFVARQGPMGGPMRWGPRTEMPKGWYGNVLNNMWNMWRAYQTMPGPKEWIGKPVYEAIAGLPQHPG